MLKPHDKHEQAVIKRAGRKHDEEAHGGAWKVAFADFCLALLSLFLVLWLMAAREQQTMKEVMREAQGSKLDEGKGVMPESQGGPRGSLIERFPMPRDGSGNTAASGKKKSSAETSASDSAQAQESRISYETPADLAALSRALTKMSAEAGLSSNLESVITPYGLRVMLHDTDRQGMFMLGSSNPTERFRVLLRQMGPLFAQMNNQMLIVGHTDSIRYITTSYSAFSNWTLSSNRAMAARSELLAGNMREDSVLQVVGMADRAPLDVKNAAAGVNRRIEILILTRSQAQSIAAMFGMTDGQTLAPGVDTSVPDVKELKQLRDKLVPKKGASDAN
ncbi:MAG: flagellar motor protein MotB [Pseudomonadota bacterium]